LENKEMNSMRVKWKKPVLFAFLVLVLIFLGTLPIFFSPYTIVLLISIFMYIILGISWTSFCVPANYISLATAAFFGVGVYVSALFQELPFPIIIVIGGFFSLILGFLVGLTTLRLSGMYFCVFTFGLSELFRHTLVWYEVNITHTVGRWVALQTKTTVYYYMLAILCLTVLAAYLIKRSKFGLALQSIGQSERAAAHIGINVNAIKIITFGITSFFMGATGAVMATRWSYIDPNLAFAPFVTFFTIMMVLVGGWNSTIWGPVIGATVLTILSDKIFAKFPNMTMLLFGAVLILVITFLSNGLIGIFQWKTKPEKSGAQ